jgi:hypothetical protein
MDRILLESADGTIDLTLGGYQYPNATNRYDANWLVVALAVRRGDEEFERRDPALETIELHALESLLRQSAAHAETFLAWDGPRLASRAHFTEPCLSFEVFADEGIFLRVYLSHELLPPFAEALDHVPWLDDEMPGVSEAWLDFPVSKDDLTRLADVVATWRKAFPVRTE